VGIAALISGKEVRTHILAHGVETIVRL